MTEQEIEAAKEKTAVTGEEQENRVVHVICGFEEGELEVDRFGPGGISRCVKFANQQYISLIELEALAGKKSKNWKTNIRVAKTGKAIKSLFDAGLLKACDKNCTCENCDIGRRFPTNLEILIESIYLKKPGLTPIKSEPQTPSKSSKPIDVEIASGGNNVVTAEDEEDIQMRSTRTQEPATQASTSTILQASDVKDEFCTSPDPAPKKDEVSEEPTTPTPIRRVSTRSAVAVPPTSPPHTPILTSSSPDCNLSKSVPPMVIHLPELVDEMEPTVVKVVAAPTNRKDSITPGRRKQQDIRAFFSPPRSGGEPVEVEIVEAPAKPIPEVDLTSPVKQIQATPSEEATEDKSGKKSKKGQEKSPVEISIRRDTLVRHTRGLRLQDRTEIVKQKHALSRSGSEDSARRGRSRTMSPSRDMLSPKKTTGKPVTHSLKKAGRTRTPSPKKTGVPVTPSPKRVGRPITPSPKKAGRPAITSPKRVIGPATPSPKKAEISTALSPRKVGRPAISTPKKGEETMTPSPKKRPGRPPSDKKQEEKAKVCIEEGKSEDMKVCKPHINGLDVSKNEKNTNITKSFLNRKLSDDDILAVLENEKETLVPRKLRIRGTKRTGSTDVKENSSPPSQTVSKPVVKQEKVSPIKREVIGARRNLKRKCSEPDSDNKSTDDKKEGNKTEDPPMKKIKRSIKKEKPTQESKPEVKNKVDGKITIGDEKHNEGEIPKNAKHDNEENIVSKVQVDPADTTQSKTEDGDKILSQNCHDPEDVKELNIPSKEEGSDCNNEGMNTIQDNQNTQAVNDSKKDNNTCDEKGGEHTINDGPNKIAAKDSTITIVNDSANVKDRECEKKEKILSGEENDKRIEEVENKTNNKEKAVKNIEKDLECKSSCENNNVNKLMDTSDLASCKTNPVIEDKVNSSEASARREHVSKDYDENITIKKEAGESTKSKLVSPSKIPTYTTMIKQALEEMNVVGGEGCSKLEILLYILRKFKPKGNISTVTTKLIHILEEGTKKGIFLSSVSCPRVLKKSTATDKKSEKKDSSQTITPSAKQEKQKIKPAKLKSKENKSKSEKSVNGMKKTKVLVKKMKLDTDVEKEPKKEPVQSPRKLKEPLITICKAKKLTRFEVATRVRAYIRSKKLLDPNDKTIILCDDNLKKITKAKQINRKSVMGYLKPFMEPIN